VTPLLAAIGCLDLLSTAVFAGGVIAAALITLPSPRDRRVVQWAAAVLALDLVVQLVVFAARMSAQSSTSGGAFWLELLDTHWGRLWVIRCFGLALLVTLRVGAGPRAALAALWLLARSFQGHAGAHGTLPALIDWVHLLAAVTWLGALLRLALIGGAIAPAIALRVRRLATVSVAALVPAGIYGAFLHVPSLERLAGSPYGRVLVVKLTFAAALISIGAMNHFRHVPRLVRRNDSGASRRLWRAVRFELVIAVVVLLLSALLGVLPMPHEAMM